MPGELITENVESRFKELKSYWKHMNEGSSLVDMSKSQLNKLTKQAQSYSGIKPGMTRQPPSFYHPLFEKINLQLPTKTREINQWCFVPNTNILMDDGTQKHIEDIGIQDKVFTHTGAIKTVTEISRRFIKENIYSIRINGIKDELKVTKEHRILIIRNENATCKYFRNQENKQHCVHGKYHMCCYCKSPSIKKLEWIMAKDIKDGDFVVSPIELNFESIFELSDSFIKLLGYYVSEGNLIKGKNDTYQGVNFSIHINELNTIGKEIQKLCLDVCGKKPSIKVRKEKERENGAELVLYSTEVAKLLLKYGNQKAKEKKLSKEIMNLSIDKISLLLKTLIEGDGYQIGNNKENRGMIQYRTVSDDLASQIFLLCQKCGLSPTIRKSEYICNENIRDKSSKKIKRTINDIRLSINDLRLNNLNINKIDVHNINMLRNPTSMKFENYILRRVKEINAEFYEGYVHNIEVEDDHTYIANFIVVHNCRHFYKTDGYVGNLIDLHSEFPLTGMHLSCDDTKIKKFFEILFFDVLRGQKLLLDINLEYWKVANVFPFGEWDENKGIWTRFVCLNPDFVEVEKSMLVDEPVLKLDPDDNLKRIVQSRQPRELYSKLAEMQGGKIVNLIARGEKIPLNQFRVSHIAYKLSPYETVGTPIMFRAFKPLIYKDILRRVQMAIGERHITPIKVAKIGTDQIPATPEAIIAAKEAFDELSYDLSGWFFYHHAISFDYVSSSGKIQPLDREYDWIEKEVTAALLGSKTIIDGSGPNFATASVALRILINRYLRNQEVLKDWVKNVIFRPVAIKQNFVRTNEWGDEEYIIPDIEFEFMNLRDDNQQKQLMKELMKMGVLSKQTYFSYIGLNYEKEKRIVKKEQEDDKKEKLTAIPEKKKPELLLPGVEEGAGEMAPPELPPAPEIPVGPGGTEMGEGIA